MESRFPSWEGQGWVLRISEKQQSLKVILSGYLNNTVGNKSPKEYFELVFHQMEDGNQQLTGLTSEKEIQQNLERNAVPSTISTMTLDDYPLFLAERRKLMSDKIRDYYFSL